MRTPSELVLLPDAGPLITLAYADALELLFKPGWRVGVVDMVVHEVTRNQTPTSEKLAKWIQLSAITVFQTQTFARYRTELGLTSTPAQRKSNLGELAIQETVNQFALQQPPQSAVLLFEDHRIARSSFFLPTDCLKISTRAFLTFLEQTGRIESAIQIERRAVQAGRAFSQLRFPP
jgi:hypothetical protein